MTIWGINALNHDAGIAVISSNIVTFQKRSSEYTGIQGDIYLNRDIIKDALDTGIPEKIVWYENPWSKKFRQLRAGQLRSAFNAIEIPKTYLRSLGLPSYTIEYASHHGSHAAHALTESKFNHTVILVADAIGEWDTLSVWLYSDGKLGKLLSRKYSYSLGLFYSAMTEVAGFVPCREENKLTELSLLGNSERYYKQVVRYINRNNHKGIWDLEIPENDLPDFAAAVQKAFEDQLEYYIQFASQYSTNIVFTGGCAFNKQSHHLLSKYFKDYYVPRNPGDGSSALGAIYYSLAKKV
jgi:carbamoyltransferase